MINGTSTNVTQDAVNIALTSFLSENMKYVIIGILILAIGLAGVVFLIVKFVLHILNRTKEIDIGPFKIQNFEHTSDDETGQKNPEEKGDKNNKHKHYKIPIARGTSISVNTFLNILDLVLSSELHSIISHCIAASDELNKIGLRYDLQCESIFNRMFLNLKNEYYIGMMNIAMKTLNLDHERIKCTREYFFICDLLFDFEERWKKTAKEITRRNGFVEFKTDISRSKNYINELENCAFQCIDIEKLDLTDLKKEDIDNCIKQINETQTGKLQLMFTELAELKIQMFSKRNYQLQVIDDLTSKSTDFILNELMEKFLGNPSNIGNTNESKSNHIFDGITTESINNIVGSNHLQSDITSISH